MFEKNIFFNDYKLTMSSFIKTSFKNVYIENHLTVRQWCKYSVETLTGIKFITWKYVGNSRKKFRNRSIFVFPCPYFGAYGFCASAPGSSQPLVTFFFSNGRVCQVTPRLKAHFAKNTTHYLFPVPQLAFH
jgi:hypothetical protein